eukprot:COSAG06_NODE_2974_length_6007_cov_12.810765_6_plen_81_part_00
MYVSRATAIIVSKLARTLLIAPSAQDSRSSMRSSDVARVCWRSGAPCRVYGRVPRGVPRPAPPARRERCAFFSHGKSREL